MFACLPELPLFIPDTYSLCFQEPKSSCQCCHSVLFTTWIFIGLSLCRWYIQHVQKAEKEAEIADSSYAQAGDFAHRMEMEEGRAVMRIW